MTSDLACSVFTRPSLRFTASQASYLHTRKERVRLQAWPPGPSHLSKTGRIVKDADSGPPPRDRAGRRGPRQPGPDLQAGGPPWRCHTHPPPGFNHTDVGSAGVPRSKPPCSLDGTFLLLQGPTSGPLHRTHHGGAPAAVFLGGNQGLAPKLVSHGGLLQGAAHLWSNTNFLMEPSPLTLPANLRTQEPTWPVCLGGGGPPRAVKAGWGRGWGQDERAWLRVGVGGAEATAESRWSLSGLGELLPEGPSAARSAGPVPCLSLWGGRCTLLWSPTPCPPPHQVPPAQGLEEMLGDVREAHPRTCPLPPRPQQDWGQSPVAGPGRGEGAGHFMMPQRLTPWTVTAGGRARAPKDATPHLPGFWGGGQRTGRGPRATSQPPDPVKSSRIAERSMRDGSCPTPSVAPA